GCAPSWARLTPVRTSTPCSGCSTRAPGCPRWRRRTCDGCSPRWRLPRCGPEGPASPAAAPQASAGSEDPGPEDRDEARGEHQEERTTESRRDGREREQVH